MKLLLRAAEGAPLVLALLVTPGGCRSSIHRPPMAAPQTVVDANDAPAFVVGLVLTMAPPVSAETLLGFRLSSNMTGTGTCYLVSVVGDVMLLAGNLPLAAMGSASVESDRPRPGDACPFERGMAGNDEDARMAGARLLRLGVHGDGGRRRLPWLSWRVDERTV